MCAHTYVHSFANDQVACSTDAPNSDNVDDDDVNTGAIVGGVVGGLAGVILLILPIILLWFWYNKNRGEKNSTYSKYGICEYSAVYL